MNDDDLMNKIFDHINNNEKLQAIKVLVDNKSIGLKEAKDFVEALSMGNHLDFSELDRLSERREDFESFTNNFANGPSPNGSSSCSDSYL